MTPENEGIAIVVEMNQRAWDMLAASLEDVTEDESRWQSHPEANSIAVIVRHLRIESEWHLNSLVHGEAMPSEVSAALQRRIDAVPIDFARNRDALAESVAAFLEVLRATTSDGLRERTGQAYGAAAAVRPHMLAYHQAMHVMSHVGQIRSIRNLYRKTRGERARFFPDNPTYPRP